MHFYASFRLYTCIQPVRNINCTVVCWPNIRLESGCSCAAVGRPFSDKQHHKQSALSVTSFTTDQSVTEALPCVTPDSERERPLKWKHGRDSTVSKSPVWHLARALCNVTSLSKFQRTSGSLKCHMRPQMESRLAFIYEAAPNLCQLT